MSDTLVGTPAGFVPRVAVSFGQNGDSAVAVEDAHALPVGIRAAAVTYVDRSGTIATGGTAQQPAPANAGRKGFFLQNVSSGDLWLDPTSNATAGQPALRIAAGQLYESPVHGVPPSAISILGAGAGQAFTAREW